VPAQGGTVTRLTTLDAGRQEVSHRWPMLLPDGKHVVFLNRTPQPDERLALYITAIDPPDAGKIRKLTAADSPGLYADGHLYFMRGSTLFAQPFDLRRFELTGEMAPAIERVWSDPDMDGLYAFSIAGGMSAFRNSEAADSQLAWFDRSGKMLGTVGPASASDPELSPDGRLLAFDMSDTRASGTATGLWTLDLERGTRTRIGPATRIDQKLLGQTQESALLRSSLWKYPESWSPNGRYLLFTQLDPKTKADLWLLPLENGAKPTPFVNGDADDLHGRFSPDGRWVAYSSNESGRFEVYVRPFPASDDRWQVSVNGGTNPLWRADGRELFYLGDNRIMSATVSSQGGKFEGGIPAALFQVRVARGSSVGGGDRYYAVSSRGDRFIVKQFNGDVRASTITVVVSR
jgi:hypothetical protein